MTEIEGYRLSPQQLRLFQLDAAPEAYRAAGLYIIDGELRRSELAAAVSRLVARYEVFRTSFSKPAGLSVPLQAAGPPAEIELAWQDLDGAASRLDELFASFCSASLSGSLEATGVRISEQRHALMVRLPAACADLVTLANLGAELSTLLAGEALSDEPLQYPDLAEWMNTVVEEDDSGEERAYWKKHAVTPETPAFLGRATGRFEPRVISLEADSSLLSRAADDELANLLLAAWATLIRRHLSSSEVTIGVGCPGRDYQGLAEAMGPFMRYVPVTVAVDLEESFASLGRRVDTVVREATEWQEYYQPTASSHLSVGFDYHRTTVAAGVTLARSYFCLDRFDLRISCHQHGGELDLELHFDPSCISDAEASWLAARFETLLGALDRDHRLGELPILGDQERRSLLAFNPTVEAHPPDACIHQLIRQQAVRTPGARAAAGPDSELTYAELDAASDRLAHRLCQRGAGPGSAVGLLLRPTPDMLVGILGILKAGAAYVPIETTYPGARIAFMLEDSGAEILVTTTADSAALPAEHGAEVVLLDQVMAGPLAAPPEVDVRPSHPAYVIYTSGSTGRPKGVVVRHRNLVYSSWARSETYPAVPERFLLLSSYAFDSSVVGIFWTLCQGGTIVIPGQDSVRDPELLARLIESHRVTHTLCLPWLYSLLLSQVDRQRLKSFELVLVAGEACPAALTELHHQRLPETSLYNEYGPTEATVWSSVAHLSTATTAGTVPIGRPIPGSRLYVLDERRAPVPIGVPGELYIAGPGVAAGYLGQPQLTAERFVPDTFGGEMYRTGDFVRWHSDGVLEFLGRVDQQVKVRGYRIELGEIEAALAGRHGVTEAAVIATDDGDKALVAYVVGGSAGGAELRQHLAERLPEYMVPASFVRLDAMPRLANGKVDRDSLPAPEPSRPDLDQGYVAPRNDLEELIAQRWCEVLNLDRVGVMDGFFDLGGNSISGAIMVNKLRADLGDVLSVGALFDHPRVAELAEIAAKHPVAATGAGPHGRIERMSRSTEMLDRVSELSDEQVSEMLEGLLSQQ